MKQKHLAVMAGVSVTAAVAMVFTTHIVHGQTVIPPFSICSSNIDVASLLPGGATTQIGNLGLTSTEEDEIVAFLQTLTDGFVTSPTALAVPAKKR